jgi:hypothetical protein
MEADTQGNKKNFFYLTSVLWGIALVTGPTMDSDLQLSEANVLDPRSFFKKIHADTSLTLDYMNHADSVGHTKNAEVIDCRRISSTEGRYSDTTMMLSKTSFCRYGHRTN